MSIQTPRRHCLASSFVLGMAGALAVVGGCQNDGPSSNGSADKKAGPATRLVPQSMPSPIPPVVTTQISSAKWKPLFDGKTLGDWKASGYGGQGEPEVAGGLLVLPSGEQLTGVTWGGAEIAKTNYEISLEARRDNGGDFFCGLTFPVAESHATLVLGGWGGAVCGISSLNGDDAANNETTKTVRFESGRWYKVRVRVTPDKLRAWLDDEKLIEVVTAEKQIDVRPDIAESKPLGIATYRTTASVRDIKIRDLEAHERGAGK